VSLFLFPPHSKTLNFKANGFGRTGQLAKKDTEPNPDRSPSVGTFLHTRDEYAKKQLTTTSHQHRVEGIEEKGES
jgi:hypothetical protein